MCSLKEILHQLRVTVLLFCFFCQDKLTAMHSPKHLSQEEGKFQSTHIFILFFSFHFNTIHYT